MADLAEEITSLFEQGASAPKERARETFARLRAELSAGRVRAAEPDPSSPTGWRVNVWVKQGILLGLRWGDIVEDEVLVGGNCGVYEGAIIKRRAVLAAGTIVTGSTPLYDLVNGVVIKPEPGQPVVVPEAAVVVPGARAVTAGKGPEWGLSVATPVIVKYRDEKTDARTELEAWIR